MAKKIKVLALDIYGTILATDDEDNELPPRKGLEAFLDKCDDRGIKVVSASDADLENLKIDLREAGVDIYRFDNLFCLDQYPYKDFLWIVKDYKIDPKELLVIGDSDKDIDGAKAIGARYFRVPEYKDKRDGFDLNIIPI